jgi:hypothetical protein
MSYTSSFEGQDVPVRPGSTSYFSQPSAGLDPMLFTGKHLRPWVRNGITRMLFDHLAVAYMGPNRWVSAWLAGSGVSYQWESAREPGDLDCLVGINYVVFRQLNSDYAGLSNSEIAGMFNESFYKDLMPKTANWEGYELTYYVNPASDIRDINPYAAYDLINDSWTVEPDPKASPPHTRAWEERAKKDNDTATQLIKAYSQALTDYRGSAANAALKVNAEARLKIAIDRAADFYEEMHHGRSAAFSPTGAGYSDFNNYRWQSGKQSGIVQALRMLKEYRDEAKKSEEVNTYGVELPSADVLIRRTLTYKGARQ